MSYRNRCLLAFSTLAVVISLYLSAFTISLSQQEIETEEYVALLLEARQGSKHVRSLIKSALADTTITRREYGRISRAIGKEK